MLTNKQRQDREELRQMVRDITQQISVHTGLLQMAVDEGDMDTAHDISLFLQEGNELLHGATCNLRVAKITERTSLN